MLREEEGIPELDEAEEEVECRRQFKKSEKAVALWEEVKYHCEAKPVAEVGGGGGATRRRGAAGSWSKRKGSQRTSSSGLKYQGCWKPT